MKTVQLLVVIAWCTLIPTLLYSEVPQFEETFDGEMLTEDETVTQLAATGWFVSSTRSNAVIRHDQLVISSGPTGAEFNSYHLFRRLEGFGSFRTSVRFDNLDLDDLHFPTAVDSTAGFGISLSIMDDISLSTIAGAVTHIGEYINNEAADDDTKWQLSFQGSAHLTSKTTGEIEIGVAYNASERRLTSFFTDTSSMPSPSPVTTSTVLGEDEADLGSSLVVDLGLVTTRNGSASVSIKDWSLVRLPEISGDFTRDRAVDVDDANELLTKIAEHSQLPWYDLDFNNRIDQADLQFWVHDLKKTYYGDANLDGEFNSADLVNIFAEGKYEDGISTNARWESGDWNADLEFDTSDLVVAFQDGGYEQGPMQAAAVPEVVSLPLVLLSGLWCLRRRDRAACQ